MIDIEDLKRQINIGRVLNYYSVKQGAGPTSWFCEFHKDNKASMVATPGGHKWQCLGCKNGGDEFDYVMARENYTLNQAAEKLADLFGFREATQALKAIKCGPLSKKQVDYLASRLITETTAKRFQIKCADTRIYFPHRRDGILNTYKYINWVNKEDKGVSGTDRSAKLWPDYDFEGKEQVFFTAGEYDCMLLDQEMLKQDPALYKISKVVTNSAGESNFPKDMVERLGKFPDIQMFYIYYDHDDPGRTGAIKLAEELLKLGKPVTIKYFPGDSKDKYDTTDFFKDGYTFGDYLSLQEEMFTEVIEEDPEVASKKLQEEIIEVQKAVLFYLIRDDNKIRLFGDTIDENDFITPRFKNCYRFMDERMNKLGYCDFNMLEVNNKAIADEIMGCRYVIGNDPEMEEFIDKLLNFAVSHKARLFKNRLVSIIDSKLVFDRKELTELIEKEVAQLIQASKVHSKNTLISQSKKDFTGRDIETSLFIPTPYFSVNVRMGGGLRYGKMHVIAGRPSSGKSTFLANMLDYIHKMVPTALFSLEMDLYEIVQGKFAREFKSELSVFREPKSYAHLHEEMLAKITEYDDNYRITVDMFDIDEIVRYIKIMVAKYGIRVVAIDHFHLLKKIKGMQAKEFYDYASNALMYLAKELGIIIIVVCQLNRIVEGRSNPKPILSDLKETGNLEQDAFSVQFIYAKDKDKQQSARDVTDLIAKIREGGEVGEIEFTYERSKGLFLEKEEQFR